MGRLTVGKVMYALYSKGFAKKATDLNKNDFKDAHTFKLTTKAKSADKVAFEGNVSDNSDVAKMADMKFTVPIDDSFSASIKTTSGGLVKNEKTGEQEEKGKETTATCEFKFDANLKLTAEVTDFKLPNVQESKKILGSAEYVTESFSVEAKVCKAKGASGAMAALAFDCPGLEVVRVGVQPAVDLNDKDPDINLNFGFAHEDKDYQLAATMGTCKLLRTEKALTGCSVRGWFKVSDSVSVAAEFDHVAKMKAGREAWETAKPTKEGNSFKFGVEYKINPSTTSKVKVTSAGAKPTFDVSLKTALEGKSNAVVCVKLEGDKPQFGLNYTLEA